MSADVPKTFELFRSYLKDENLSALFELFRSYLKDENLSAL